MEQAINKIKCWQSLGCNEYICTYSSGQTIVLYHKKVAWNNFSVYLIYDTALLKPGLEQVCELQSEVVSGGRFILLWAWHTVAVTLSRVAMSRFRKFTHTRMTGNHMSQTAKMSWVGGFFQSLISQAVYLTQIAHNTPLLKFQHRMRPEVSVWISFCLVYNKSNSCKAVLALSYVFAHFCWLKSHFLLGKLLRKVYFLHSYKLLA